ncbi:oxygen-independent coproporphyrinogen III oxidase [Hyphobacterium sp.]|uniref:oxygen-independent coproporphyrinogen III oxidase n=1 Tax=Hyphobacterium sp. TaxID=2004662 RepID=UPI003B516FA3
MTSLETHLKYAVQNTPRYTSYPTAPHFQEGITGKVYASWLGELGRSDTGSLYVHIPYCREMCWYCGCSTRATRRQAPIAAYLETLMREIKQTAALAPERLRIGHLHFGGGTPTILSGDQLAALMEALRRHFDIDPEAEIAIEIDPRVFTPELASNLVGLGVNRASIGVQTFDPVVQAKINRTQSYDTVARCTEALRHAGINRISFDILYGLPAQTRDSCINTLRQALQLRPDRVSVFGYAHVPHMRRQQRLIDENDLPKPAARIEQALAIAEALAGEGYVQIGIDHYARADDNLARLAAAKGVCRNFQGYTTDQSSFLIGLGASAISRLPRGYAQNTADVRAWSQAIETVQLATCRGIELSREDRVRGAVIERLMCDLEADIGAIAASQGTSLDLPDLADLEADGLVLCNGSRIAIPESCRMLARIVAARFDAHLQNRSAVRHSSSV